MASSICLQPWTTARGGAGVVVVQPLDAAADMLSYHDYTLFMQVSDFSNATIILQTSPSRDEGLFKDIGASITPASAALFFQVVRYETATVPLARYLRWKITNASAWSLTFTLWIAANWCGYARKQLPDHKRSLNEYLKRYDDAAKRAAPQPGSAPAPTAMSPYTPGVPAGTPSSSGAGNPTATSFRPPG